MNMNIGTAVYIMSYFLWLKKRILKLNFDLNFDLLYKLELCLYPVKVAQLF